MEYLHKVDGLKGHDFPVLRLSLEKQVGNDVQFAQFDILDITHLHENTSVEYMSGERDFSFFTTSDFRLDGVLLVLSVNFYLLPVKLNDIQLVGADRGIKLRHHQIGHEGKYLYDHLYFF